MRYTNRDYRLKAKEALRGNYGVPVAAFLLVYGGSMMVSWMTSFLFRGSSLLTVIIGQLFSFGITLILGIFLAGLARIFLEISRYEPYSLKDLLYFFSRNPDRVIVAGFVLGIIQEITTIPVYFVMYGVPSGDSAEEQAQWLLLLGLAMVAQIILEVLVTLPFAMVYLLLGDYEDMSGMEALKESMRLMRGAKGKYFLLLLSFVPYFLLCAFTLYVAILWVMPYLQVAECFFYRDLLGELNPMHAQREEAFFERREATDDYNSEA